MAGKSECLFKFPLYISMQLSSGNLKILNIIANLHTQNKNYRYFNAIIIDYSLQILIGKQLFF